MNDMRKFLISLAVAACALFITASPFRAAYAAGAVLAPHKALYDIKMVSRHSGAEILNLSGQMLFEGKLSCEAWITDHRFKLVYEYADAEPMLISSDYSTYETLDNRELNFTSRRERNGELFEEIRGHAALDEKGAGQAVYSLPEGLTFDLAHGSLFPTAHTEAALREAAAGKKFFSATVFDGSDQEGPVEINTFIGARVKDIGAIVAPANAIDKKLLASPARKVRMAFFPLNKEEAEADYEMDVILHDNGIISDMYINYGDFSVTQKLIGLEKLDVPACNAKKAR